MHTWIDGELTASKQNFILILVAEFVLLFMVEYLIFCTLEMLPFVF
jgi:hypothetical protein